MPTPPNPFAPLTPEEKARVRHHTGYFGVANAQTFALGMPAMVQTQFLIEGAMNLLLPESLNKFRELLEKCDCTEAQMFTDQENLAVNRIGSIEINPDEQDKLRKVYRYWQAALCNMLGVPPNPYDMRFAGAGAGGLNVPVLQG